MINNARREIEVLESHRGEVFNQGLEEAYEMKRSRLRPVDEENKEIAGHLLFGRRQYSGHWDPLPGFGSGLCH